MKTDFKDYLKKKKAQKKIDEIAKQYKDKKIVLYGAGLFASELIRNYDFSSLNIIGVADKKFQDNFDGDFYGYTKFSPYDLLETEFDLILITTYDDTDIKKFLKNELLQGENITYEIKTLIGLNLFEYIKGVFKNEV